MVNRVRQRRTVQGRQHQIPACLKQAAVAYIQAEEAQQVRMVQANQVDVEERRQSGWNFLPQQENTRAGSDFNSEDDHATEAVNTKVINSLWVAEGSPGLAHLL